MDTKEKILNNIERINKRINPNSKKSIVLLEDDPQFKALIDSVKSYVNEYNSEEVQEPFPGEVYNAIYNLIEYSTEQFENDTNKIKELNVKMEKNLQLARILKNVIDAIINQENWRTLIDESTDKIPEDITEQLISLGRIQDTESQEYIDLKTQIEAEVGNLESNLHIEIDLERLNDRIKALSYIGVEVSEAFKNISNYTKVETSQEANQEEAAEVVQADTYEQETRFEAKLSLWQRFKNSSFCRAIKYLFSLQVTIQPALPSGEKENK